MKTQPHETTRFTCRLARGALAVFGDTTAGMPRGPGAAHVATCADCQRFFAAGDELDQALRGEAAHEWHEAPAGLEASILRAVRQSAPSSPTRAPRGLWLSLAGASAAAVLAVLVYQKPQPESVMPSVTASANDPAVFDAARQLIAAVPTDLFDEMRPRAQALLAQDPLQNEIDAVKSDARAALRFLAANFLPASATEPAQGE